MSGEDNSSISSDLEGENVTVFVIGDPHFKAKHLDQFQEFVEKLLISVKSSKPDFIVVLGDTLDTHEIVRVQPHNLACEMIEKLSQIAPTYLLIGNHDYINHTQFLTSKHIFGPLKKWANVYVIDKPVYVTHGIYSFVFCPYVEPGRFVEALNHLVVEGETWDLTDCIFAHQEFYGCKMGAITSENGDKWDENYPPVISGHIHNDQTVGTNIFYPGSAFQHAFGESSDKRVWMVTFGGQDQPPYFSIRKIDIGMKGKKIVYLDVDKIKKFDEKLTEKYQIKLVLRGTSEQFKVFRQGGMYQHLQEKGVTYSYKPILDRVEIEDEKRTRDQVSFLGMLKEIVQYKADTVKKAYQEIVDDTDFNSSDDDTVIYDLVFESDD